MGRTRTSRAGEDRGTDGQGGFTLVEMVVVLLILCMALVVMQAASRPSPELELRTAASETAALFREARAIAIRDNREAAVAIDLDAHTLSIDGSGQERPLAPDLGITLRTASSELIREGAGAIRFFPDGSSTGGRVTLFANERKYYVVVNWLTGRTDVRQ